MPRGGPAAAGNALPLGSREAGPTAPATCSAPVETSTPAVPDPDGLRGLLATYQRLIEVAGTHQSIVTVGRERFAVEHVRRALATLERRFSAHAAVSENGAPDTSESRERIRQALASLPPPQSRVRPLLLAALVLVVARPVVTLAGDVSLASLFGRTDTESGASDATAKLTRAISAVGDLSLGNLSEAVKVVFSTNLLTTSIVFLVFGAAAYLVLQVREARAIDGATIKLKVHDDAGHEVDADLSWNPY